MIDRLQRYQSHALQLQPFCIVGAGAAGISLAVALSRAGHRVVLIDGGDGAERPAFDDAYRGDADRPHPATAEYRRQRFGGTTHLWGGRCVPLDPIDMQPRAHVPNSGWPVSYPELATWLPGALDFCDAGAADFSVQALAGAPAPLFADLPRLAPAIDERIERYSLPTDFARKYRRELAQSPRVQVVLRARCVGITVTDAGDHVEAIRVTDGTQTLEIRAACFILCGGGIETPRLLLATRRQVPAWSRFDASLGRYYGCHFDLIYGSLTFKEGQPFFDFQKTRDGVYARRKLQYSAAFQTEHRLLNGAFRLHFPAYADPGHGSGVLSTIYLAKSVLSSEHQSILNHGVVRKQPPGARVDHLKNIATDFRSVLGFGADWLFKRKLAHRKMPYTLVRNRNGSYPLEFNSEQIPDPGNRIELQTAADADGMPRVNIRWKLTETDIRSGVESFVHMRDLLATTPHCRLAIDRSELEERVANALPVGGHHIGATRMGLSPATSVVDGNCRVHGVDNLFVASASVFATNGHANPTLTIVALALRLAAHLDQQVVDAGNGSLARAIA